MTAAKLSTIQRLIFQIVQQPLYSPDLAPSDYLLFEAVVDALKGHRFKNIGQDQCISG